MSLERRRNLASFQNKAEQKHGRKIYVVAFSIPDIYHCLIDRLDSYGRLPRGLAQKWLMFVLSGTKTDRKVETHLEAWVEGDSYKKI